MENLKIDNILSNEKIVDVTTTDTIEYKNLLSENTFLKNINNELLAKVEDLTTRLHKYTNGENHKRYYEKNKEKIKQSGATYLQKLKTENPDKIKAYSKQAYANKKKKLLEASKFDASNNAQPLTL